MFNIVIIRLVVMVIGLSFSISEKTQAESSLFSRELAQKPWSIDVDFQTAREPSDEELGIDKNLVWQCQVINMLPGRKWTSGIVPTFHFTKESGLMGTKYISNYLLEGEEMSKSHLTFKRVKEVQAMKRKGDYWYYITHNKHLALPESAMRVTKVGYLRITQDGNLIEEQSFSKEDILRLTNTYKKDFNGPASQIPGEEQKRIVWRYLYCPKNWVKQN